MRKREREREREREGGLMRIKVQTSKLSHRCFEKYYTLNNSHKQKFSHLKLRQYARYLKSGICILKKAVGNGITTKTSVKNIESS